MKTLSIIFLASCIISSAETADEIMQQTLPGFIGFNNGLDRSPEGQRKAALNNAKWSLQHFMASDKVPEGVRVSYAIQQLREMMRTRVVFKEGERTNKNEIVLQGIDEEKTKLLREQFAKKIIILENRLAVIYNPHKEAEQGGTGQPATRPESKSDGSDKPQPGAEGRSR
ncbi:hypothetical protein HZ994_09410 [Akkermansiaceae bacterium]|nr:hypothetical protein HZ994_09410 [Akkermansiaceae bacterium]